MLTGQCIAHLQKFHGHDLQPTPLKATDQFTNQSALHGVRFEDDKGLFHALASPNKDLVIWPHADSTPALESPQKTQSAQKKICELCDLCGKSRFCQSISDHSI
jgi:hypothetical protein